MILLACGDEAPPLTVQFVPVPQDRTTHEDRTAALIYIWNPALRSESLSGTLTQLYGLTGAEARLASLLATGIRLDGAAERLRITRNTARNQLQSIFAKTGTTRQNEFLVRILGLLDI